MDDQAVSDVPQFEIGDKGTQRFQPVKSGAA
jgi:hypothetical protein